MNVPMLWGGVANQPWGRVTAWAVRWARRVRDLQPPCPCLCGPPVTAADAQGQGTTPLLPVALTSAGRLEAGGELCWLSLGTGGELYLFGTKLAHP